MKFKLEEYHRNVPKEELLNDLKKVSSELGRDFIKRKEYREKGKYAVGTFIKRFGSWKTALAQAGLYTARNWGTTLEEYFKNLEEIWTKLARQPRYEDMQIPFSKLSGAAYLHKFGTWRKALEQFVKYINQKEFLEPDLEQIKSISRHKTKKSISWRLRFIVMRKDGFKCKSCGRSPATDSSIVLHVDHIQPWSKGGETILENLQTLCSKCNLGKGNLEN